MERLFAALVLVSVANGKSLWETFKGKCQLPGSEDGGQPYRQNQDTILALYHEQEYTQTYEPGIKYNIVVYYPKKIKRNTVIYAPDGKLSDAESCDKLVIGLPRSKNVHITPWEAPDSCDDLHFVTASTADKKDDIHITTSRITCGDEKKTVKVPIFEDLFELQPDKAAGAKDSDKMVKASGKSSSNLGADSKTSEPEKEDGTSKKKTTAEEIEEGVQEVQNTQKTSETGFNGAVDAPSLIQNSNGLGGAVSSGFTAVRGPSDGTLGGGSLAQDDVSSSTTSTSETVDNAKATDSSNTTTKSATPRAYEISRAAIFGAAIALVALFL